eukprot:scaffold139520_cov18-Tisochrysis_lutea.AAC.2
MQAFPQCAQPFRLAQSFLFSLFFSQAGGHALLCCGDRHAAVVAVMEAGADDAQRMLAQAQGQLRLLCPGQVRSGALLSARWYCAAAVPWISKVRWDVGPVVHSACSTSAGPAAAAVPWIAMFRAGPAPPAVYRAGGLQVIPSCT